MLYAATYFLKNPVQVLSVEGPKLVPSGLAVASASCAAKQVCFTQDANGMDLNTH